MVLLVFDAVADDEDGGGTGGDGNGDNGLVSELGSIVHNKPIQNHLPISWRS
jgi:hypothetical protein